MKRHRLGNRLVLGLLAVCGACLLLAACAGMDASNQETLLSGSGFSLRKPETAEQHEIYQFMEPYKLQSTTIKGKVLYAYKHEMKGVVYVGGEPQYQQYQRLALQQRIAQQNMMAAQMNQDLAMRWSHWGPRGYGW